MKQAERSEKLARIAEVLRSQRQRIDGFLSSHQRRLADLETRFAGEFEIVNARLQEWDEFQSEVEQNYHVFQKDREDVERQRLELNTRAHELERLQQSTETQRRRIGQKLDERRRRLATDQMTQRLELERQIDDLTRKLNVAQDAAKALKSESDGHQQAFGQSQQTIERLQREIKRLTDELRQNASLPNADSEELAELKEKYEMASESLEALRRQKDRLSDELTELRERMANEASSPHSKDDGQDEPSNWEATKRRLLANLAYDDTDTDDRQRIEDHIRRTDDYLADKDREVAALRAQVESLNSAQLAAVSEAPNHAITQAVDADEAIAAARQKVTQLQAEWQEKLRQAEVECARERAQNARLRSELQGKIRDVESELSRLQGAAAGVKGSGRKWLDHLGLNDS